jgi:uncharacterized protein YdeI (YjbR/CyaY-like superfamily)
VTALFFTSADELRRRLESYMLRFTPRKERSSWSARNVARAEKLRDQGLMHEAGLRVFDRRIEG